MYKIWSSVVYDANVDDLERGVYRSAKSKFDDDQKIEILNEMLLNMIELHPIVASYLKSTGDSELIYQISKYESFDKRWLGYNYQSNIGENNLGIAWMKIRNSLSL